MSTITLPNIRVSSDLTVKVRLKDSGVAIDWSTLTKIKASIYSDAQRALAGRCDVSIDAEDSTLLVCNYAANKPQYVGVNRIVVSAKYMGETKTYDKPAFTFVRWTADQEGEQITIDDPDVDVEIEVEDISSSILQEAVDAAFAGAERANEAAAAAEHMVDIHTGPEGKSAYEVAVEEGYTGTEEEWLASLVGPQGAQGIQGETGEAAGFGTVSVSLQEDGGQPSATVAASGTDTAKNFAFTFNNLKGEKGDKGDQGNSGYTGAAGELEVVNNLTDGGAAKALSAEMGKTLEGEVSQLEAKVDELDDAVNGIVETETDITNRFSFTDNKYIGANPSKTTYGTQTTDSSNTFKASAIVNVSAFAGKTMKIAFLKRSNAEGEQTNLGLCFYGTDLGTNVLVGYQFPAASAPSTVEFYELVVTIDPAWKTVRTTYVKDEQTYGAFYCKIYGTESKGTLQEQLDDHEERIQDNEQDLTVLKDKEIEVCYNVVNQADSDYQQNKLLYNGSRLDDYNGYDTTGYIPAKANDTFRLAKIPDSTNYKTWWAWYDKDKTLIGYYNENNTGDYPYLLVPNNDAIAYIRVTIHWNLSLFSKTRDNIALYKTTYYTDIVWPYGERFILNNDTIYGSIGSVKENLETLRANAGFWKYAADKFICFGDSLTDGLYSQGLGVSLIQQNYPYYIGRMLNTPVENAGKNGSYPTKCYSEKYPTYTITEYNTILIWLGTNGGLRVTEDATGYPTASPEKQYVAYKSMLADIRENNTDCLIILGKVFITGNINNNVERASAAETNTAIDALAQEYNCLVIDFSDLGYSRHPELHADNNDTHFGKAGNIFIANRIVTFLESYFSSNVLNCEYGLNPKEAHEP